MRRFLLPPFAAAVVLWCGGCAGPFAVRPADPLRGRAEKTGTALVGAPSAAASADDWMAEGVRAQRDGESARAEDAYLLALDKLGPANGQTRRGNPKMAEGRRFATARLTELCTPTLLADPGRPLDLTGPAGRRWRVRLRRGEGPGGIAPGAFVSLTPTDRWEVTRAPSFSREEGVGAPLLGELKPVRPMSGDDVVTPADRALTQPIKGLFWATTARARLGPPVAPGNVRDVTLEIYSPLTAAASPGGEPLAADYTTELAVTGARQGGRMAWLAAFLHADNYVGLSGLFPTEPLTTRKTPLVLVHGLISDPSAFRVMHNALLADPEVRRHYQIWVFFYPTSLPVPFSAMLLRDSLNESIRRLDPAGTHPVLHRVVCVGHSMGGVLGRLILSDGGERYYRHFLRVPVDELSPDPKLRALARRVFFQPASPNVGTMVFMSTPHRGSQLVLSPVGVIGRWLGRLPRQMADDMRGLVALNPGVLAGKKRRIEGSVYLLGPHSPLVAALADMPPDARRTRLYSIIGDRGRGGPLAQSSDGVVRYRSLHLPEARRETVVPFGHSGVLTSPGAIAEVRRILHERAGE